MDIRCITESGQIRYVPEHLTKDESLMKSAGLTIQDVRLVGTKEEKIKTVESVSEIDTITDEEIKPTSDLIEPVKEKKTRKTNKK